MVWVTNSSQSSPASLPQLPNVFSCAATRAAGIEDKFDRFKT